MVFGFGFVFGALGLRGAVGDGRNAGGRVIRVAGCYVGTDWERVVCLEMRIWKRLLEV